MHIKSGFFAAFALLFVLAGCNSGHSANGSGPSANGRDTCSSTKDCPTSKCCYYTSPIYADGTLICQDPVEGCSYQAVDTQAFVVCTSNADCAGVSWKPLSGALEPALTCCAVERQPGESVQVCQPSCP